MAEKGSRTQSSEWRNKESVDHETSSETTYASDEDEISSQQSIIVDLSNMADPDDEIIFVEKSPGIRDLFGKLYLSTQEQYINSVTKNVNVITFGFTKNDQIDEQRDETTKKEPESQEREIQDQLLQLSQISEPDDEILFLSENLNQTFTNPSSR
mmetsp:Transcript_23552/g.35778  ORF Transcript_23552/g.35778 Transcript_23552/m.35778 type:complete len:155 (-) Transcript_23552:420-884(-)|eukprot:CAMPEP_0178921504 /NCGR_PEP_ID=MMETSP0786-20121207/15600_1 /TAXON_ID=186022 /ORGANISM="Thalassionema frauenfeldii, Strain CCMP 1798" /LENGTH=154 /DNA_ID=CAMNT_0020595695 /DNA_START=285 /DNA_END=749 /DNA_ORIENTATION=-